MAKNSRKTSHEASLKQRQLNGINKITNPRRDALNQARSHNRVQRANATNRDVKSKSLLDRMTSPHGHPTTSAADPRDKLSASPRKRKRQDDKQRDGDQAKEEAKDPPAKRQKPEDTTQTTARQATAKKPLLWHHIKTKQQTTPVAARTQQSAPTPSSNKVTDNSGAKSLTSPPPSKPASNKGPYPSPPSRQPSPMPEKRDTDELGGSKNDCRNPHTTITMQPVDAATAKERQAYLKPSAPAVANPDCEHVYKEYGNDSIPLLFSMHARDGRQNILLNDPSLYLQCRAIALLESPTGFAANDLGRPNVTKKGRTKIIKDLDLYLMEDNKVYVGTERGLLLVADYLKLAGIPDCTPVRFNGIKPAYVKESSSKRLFLWVATTTYDISVREAERAKMMPGELPLVYGEMVEVWAVDPTCDPINGPRYAFGKLVHDGQTGWFDLNNTVSQRKDIPEMVHPDEPLFMESDYAFSRNDPPASAAQLASLKFVKSYVSPRTAPPPAVTATPVAPHKPLSPTKSTERITSKSPAPLKSASPASNEGPQAAKADAQAPSSPKSDEVEEIKNDLENKDDTRVQEIETCVPDVREKTTSQELEGKKEEIEKDQNTTSSNKGPIRLSMLEHCAEDDVDWGDEEL